jgi:hypothetical protein
VINGGAGNLETRLRNAIFDNNGTVAITTQNGARVIFEGLTFRNTAQPYLLINSSSFEVSKTTFPSATCRIRAGIRTGIARLDKRSSATASLVSDGRELRPDIYRWRASRADSPGAALTSSTVPAANLVHLHGADAWIEDNVFLHCHRNSTAPSCERRFLETQTRETPVQ